MKRFLKKMDNRGATLVFTLIAVVVILVLASLILSLSTTNYKVKATDNQSRKNFYSVDQAANEIYSGIGTYAMDNLGRAYSTTLSNVNVGALDGTVLQTSTDKLNIYFREQYMVYMIQFMTDKTVTRDGFFPKTATGETNYPSGIDTIYTAADSTTEDYKTYALNRLVSCLSDMTGSTDVVDVALNGDIYFDYDNFELVLEDVYISYTSGDLFSSETFDMKITFPDWSMSFLKSKGQLDDPFVNYVMLAGKGLNFQTNATTTVTGGLYAAGTAKTAAEPASSTSSYSDATYGIRITGANVTVDPDQGAVVSAGDIILKSGTNSAVFTLNGSVTNPGKLWCQNLFVDSNRTPTEDKASALTLSANTAAYVADDLEIYAANNTTTINGSYYGYSFANYESEGANGDASSSSAIIVNGKKDTLNINGIVYLAGNAYINQVPSATSTFNTNYMTGESVALKTNQQAYMVPSAWMKVKDGTQLFNPCLSTQYSVGDDINLFVDTSKITFGDLLDSANPVVVKYAKAKYYFYFNFKSTDAAATYIRNYKTYLGADAPDIDSMLQDYETRVVIGGILTSVGADAQANGSTVSFSGGTTISDLVANYRNYDNRYQLMSSLLVSVDDSTIVNDKKKVNGKEYDLGYFSNTAVENYLNLAKLRSDEYKDINTTFHLSDNAGTAVSWDYQIRYSDSDLVLSGSTDPSICRIVVCDGDVTVNGNFYGMIMATGNITVASGSTYQARPEMVKALFDNNATVGGVSLKKVFTSYKGDDDDSAGDEIDQVQYSDVIELTNWRKY